MNLDDSTLPEFVEVDSTAGRLRFAGQAALLVTADTMDTLYCLLVERLGTVASRGILAHLGVTQGRQLAAGLAEDFRNVSGEDRQRRVAHLGRLSGLFESGDGHLQSPGTEIWELVNSSEALQHLAYLGNSNLPVCATLSGFLSGFFCRIEDRDLVAVEVECRACGAPACRFEVKLRQAWEAERSDSEPRRLQESLDVAQASAWNSQGGLTRLSPDRANTRSTPFPRADEVDVPGLVAHSPVMRATLDLALRLAQVDSTVLITGESGTGKERIARLIHERSARSHKPFVAVNCGAIPENLVESELFGHARGSFTGAVQAHAGIFEAAHDGTILLDEIGEISPAVQVKLLRVLQEHEVRRVGEEHSRPVDFRVLASTNRDLAERVENGLFRRDLYYRVHVVEVGVPSLRSRREDILPLARVLLADAAARMRREIEGFSAAVADRLLGYDWPGNVRELENAMERAVALARGRRVELCDLPPEVASESNHSLAKLESVRPLQDISKDYILSALALNFGNQTQTAKQLGIGTATLYRKLKQYGYHDLE